jgi:hypothetical protein
MLFPFSHHPLGIHNCNKMKSVGLLYYSPGLLVAHSEKEKDTVYKISERRGIRSGGNKPYIISSVDLFNLFTQKYVHFLKMNLNSLE